MWIHPRLWSYSWLRCYIKNKSPRRMEKKETIGLCYNYPLTPGAKVQFRSNTSASNLFFLFFTDEVWGLLTTETNRYANTNLPRQQHARPWNNISVSEMKAFVGLLIIMGVLHLPLLEMYWQRDCNLIETPGVSSIMSKVRF